MTGNIASSRSEARSPTPTTRPTTLLLALHARAKHGSSGVNRAARQHDPSRERRTKNVGRRHSAKRERGRRARRARGLPALFVRPHEEVLRSSLEGVPSVVVLGLQNPDPGRCARARQKSARSPCARSWVRSGGGERRDDSPALSLNHLGEVLLALFFPVDLIHHCDQHFAPEGSAHVGGRTCRSADALVRFARGGQANFDSRTRHPEGRKFALFTGYEPAVLGEGMEERRS